MQERILPSLWRSVSASVTTRSQIMFVGPVHHPFKALIDGTFCQAHLVDDFCRQFGTIHALTMQDFSHS